MKISPKYENEYYSVFEKHQTIRLFLWVVLPNLYFLTLFAILWSRQMGCKQRPLPLPELHCPLFDTTRTRVAYKWASSPTSPFHWGFSDTNHLYGFVHNRSFQWQLWIIIDEFKSLWVNNLDLVSYLVIEVLDLFGSRRTGQQSSCHNDVVYFSR